MVRIKQTKLSKSKCIRDIPVKVLLLPVGRIYSTDFFHSPFC